MSLKLEELSGGEVLYYTTSFFIDNMKNEVSHPFHLRYYSLYFPQKGEKIGKEYISNLWYKKESKRIYTYLLKSDEPIRMLNNHIALTDKGIKKIREINRILSKRKRERNILRKVVKEIMDVNNNYVLAGLLTFLYETYLPEIIYKHHPSIRKNSELLLSASPYKSWITLQHELLERIKKYKQKEDIEKYIYLYFPSKTTHTYRVVIEDEKDVIQLVKSIESLTTTQFSKKEFDKVWSILSEEEKRIVKFLWLTEELRDKRKYLYMSIVYVLFEILERFIEKYKLQKEKEYLYYLSFYDIAALIINPDEELIKEIVEKGKERYKKGLSVIYWNYDYHIILGFAEKYLKKEEKVLAMDNIVKGTSASKGIKRGYVKIVKGKEDFNKFKKGDVLVTYMTRPEFLPIMQQASAIITQEGGITSHAAVVSRELGIPCVVGVKDVVKILKDGDLVEVNGKNGMVKILKGRRNGGSK